MQFEPFNKNPEEQTHYVLLNINGSTQVYVLLSSMNQPLISISAHMPYINLQFRHIYVQSIFIELERVNMIQQLSIVDYEQEITLFTVTLVYILISATKILVSTLLKLYPNIFTLLKTNELINEDTLNTIPADEILENLFYIDVFQISIISWLLKTIPESMDPNAMKTKVDVETEISHLKQINAPLKQVQVIVMLIVDCKILLILKLNPKTAKLLSLLIELIIEVFVTDSVLTNMLYCLDY
ncbi:Hypothetical_protein [Hexamita inflata]|uniref:Hypothetical_protein n=1 Tax=Hexamita inflata TaxID=28002 RepID=A0AA86TV36_9EUKA|nr:Hypothetical protein HINF_LOCUS10368 [Hexamita inflata]